MAWREALLDGARPDARLGVAGGALDAQRALAGPALTLSAAARRERGRLRVRVHVLRGSAAGLTSALVAPSGRMLARSSRPTLLAPSSLAGAHVEAYRGPSPQPSASAAVRISG
jgi:hypothetical protein